MRTVHVPETDDPSSQFDRSRGTALVRAVEHMAALAFGVFLTLLLLVALRDLAGVWLGLTLCSAGIFLPALAGYAFTRALTSLGKTVTFGGLLPFGILLPIQERLLFPREPGPGPLVELGLAIGFVVSCGLMVRVGMLAKHLSHEVRWVRGAIPCIALIPIVSLSAVVGGDRTDRHSRMDLAMELHGQLWEYYPHWDRSPLKPRELWAKYRSRLSAADSACGAADAPCIPYLHALRDMFAELRNGHTEVLVPEEIGTPSVRAGLLGTQVAITHVEPGSDAAAAGLRVGMRILAVDGLPIEAALQKVPRWRIAFTSPRTRSLAGYRAMLEGPAESTVRILVADGSSAPRAVTLKRPRIRYDWELPQGEAAASELRTRTAVSADDPHYVHLDGFEGDGLQERFDAIVDGAFGSPGLILDLRENYGGVLDHMFRLLGRFYAEPVTIGEHCIPAKGAAAKPDCTVHRIEPRANVYGGPLAVLIDENVYSAGELAAYALCRTGRARCFGRTTAGETDCVFRLDLPGGVARVSWADFHPFLGPTLLGAGLDPDVSVERTLEDLRSDRDPEYDAARAWLQSLRPHHTPEMASVAPAQR